MSALDQAFIKIFAHGSDRKPDEPASADAGPDGLTPEKSAAPRSRKSAPSVDSLYAEGSLYHDHEQAELRRVVPRPHLPAGNEPLASSKPANAKRPVARTDSWSEGELYRDGYDPFAADLPAAQLPAAQAPLNRPAPVVTTDEKRDHGGSRAPQEGRFNWQSVVTTDQKCDYGGSDLDSSQEAVSQVFVQDHVLPQTDMTSGAAEMSWVDMPWLDAVPRQEATAPATPPSAETPSVATRSTAAPATEDAATEVPAAEVPVAEVPVAECLASDRQAEAMGSGPGEPRGAESGLSEVGESRAEASSGQMDSSSSSADVAWEVDQFVWPSICEQLYASEEAYFGHAGEKLRSATAEGLHVLAVTSIRRGEGRTTLALCLARAAAAAGVRTVLLEADFDRPRMARRLRVDTPCDWPHTIRRGLPWTEAAIVSVQEQLTILPLADEDDLPAPRLDDPAVTRLIRQLRSEYDLVVIDMPPLDEMNSEFFQSGESCPIHATILVRDQRDSEPAETLRAVRQVRDAGVEAVGIAKNFCGELPD